MAVGRETPSMTVTTQQDTFDLYDQRVSLREAIWHAHAGTEGTRITFDVALNGATVRLQGQSLWIDTSLTIDASTLGSLTIDAAGRSRVFTINTSNDQYVDLAGLTITGGSDAGYGGGIYKFNGSLTVTDSTLAGNSAGYGGGIYSDWGALTVFNGTFAANSASGNGGGIYKDAGTLTVTSSTLIGNSADVWGGGISDVDGTLTVIDSTLEGNSAADDGGGIYKAYNTLDVINSTFGGNSAGGRGGGVYSQQCRTAVTNGTFEGNSAADDGGGIYKLAGTLIVTNSILAGNSADNGGGISGDGGRYEDVLTVINSTLVGNTADRGGGIDGLGYVTVRNSIIAMNEASSDPNIFGELTDGSSHNLINVDPGLVRSPNDGGDRWGDNPATPAVDESANDDYGDLHLTAYSTMRSTAATRACYQMTGSTLIMMATRANHFLRMSMGTLASSVRRSIVERSNSRAI